MNEKLIKELKAKSSFSRRFEESHFFDSLFEDIFKDVYSEICDTPYLDFKIPNSFVQFLKNFPSGIKLKDHYFFGIFDCISQTFNDITLWSALDDEKKKLAPWIHIGVRGDKGNMYLCCDSSSDYFGKIEEFYDGSAFMRNAFYENMKLQTFEELCFIILNEKNTY